MSPYPDFFQSRPRGIVPIRSLHLSLITYPNADQRRDLLDPPNYTEISHNAFFAIAKQSSVL